MRSKSGLIALAMLLACTAEGDGPGVAATPPNVVLVSIDSLRPDHLGSYGYAKPTSPTLDRLAAEGVRFATAVSTTSWTLPAHAALFTGLYDSAHGLVDNGISLAKTHETLAEKFRAAGYQTAGFFGGPYLHPTFGLGQGFDTWQSCMTTLPDDVAPGALRAAILRGQDPSHQDVTGPRTVRELTRWLEQARPGPFFLFLHLWDVHYDYIAPESLVRIFDPDYTGSLDGRNLIANPAISAALPPRDREHLLALYDAEVRFSDQTLEQILAALAARGRLENTLLVVTADHGEEFFEHGGKGHQQTLYEEVVRVPLILHWPGQLAAGSVVAAPVRLIDVMPTLLELAGIGSSAPTQGGSLVPLQGRSLVPLLRGRTLPEEPALSELLVDGRDLRALRTRTHKLIADQRAGYAGWYDLVGDPGEQHALPDSPAAREALEQLAATTRGALDLRTRHALTPEPAELDALLRESLESLGYLKR
jgi:arylsulfatase A-like enzyme